MEKDKNLAEEAFIQMKNVEGIIAENAKGILASTMKEEINQLVKESLSEQEDEIETDTEIDMDSDDEMEMGSDDEMDFEDDMEMGSDDGMDSDDEMEMDFEDDMESDLTPIDLTGASDEEVLKVFKSMSDEDGIIVKKEDEGIYLTDDDTDSEYFVKMNESEDLHSEMYEEDEDMHSEIDEEDYDDEEIDMIIDQIFQESMDEEMDEEMDEVVYEIEMDEDEDEMEFEYDMESDDEMDFEPEWVDVKDLYDKKDSYDEMDEEEDVDFFSKERFVSQEQFLRESKKSVKGKGVKGNGPKFSYKDGKKGFNEKKKEGPKTMGTGKPKFNFKDGENLNGEFKPVKKKSETKEAARTLGMGSKFRKGGLPKPKAHSKFNTAIKENVNEEVAVLRQKNDEYRKALNVFRNKLNEVAIFNSNLAYATRLFTEHSTTKKEKINILRRFDNVETLKESKNLYKAIKDELSKGENKPINESVETKINKQISTGSSMNLIESKTYENPQFLRMKDLMNKIR